MDGWRVKGKWLDGGWLGKWMDEWLVLRCPERGWRLNPAQSSAHGEKWWFDRYLGAESARPGRTEGQGRVLCDAQVSSLEA